MECHLIYNSSHCDTNCIPEKTVLLQKKDNEGFGFVLRGAKAQTPIEEFTPTPAFPALQYLESVDEGGVAWRAGLRMGDFLIEVNGQNVVKVGHRQVVNMIRQGGNSLMVKVVMVARNPELEDTVRKRGKQTKRLTPPAIALRSKSMTSELEDMGKMREGRKCKSMSSGGHIEKDSSGWVSSFSAGGWYSTVVVLGKHIPSPTCYEVSSQPVSAWTRRNPPTPKHICSRATLICRPSSRERSCYADPPCISTPLPSPLSARTSFPSWLGKGRTWWDEPAGHGSHPPQAVRWTVHQRARGAQERWWQDGRVKERLQ
uniref:PDZ domain-containing protein n=1 Tax=Amphilophus citrinellus TaxID=61819 RepID=A0A3Q0QQQ6_AMPCI